MFNRRINFSLRGIFTLIVLVAVGLALWVSTRVADENKRLRAENTRLRNESGQLTIEPGEENKVHAIKIPTLESYTWRWRVYAQGVVLLACASPRRVPMAMANRLAQVRVRRSSRRVRLSLHWPCAARQKAAGNGSCKRPMVQDRVKVAVEFR